MTREKMSDEASLEPLRYKPHDLLRLRGLPETTDMPRWLFSAFAVAPHAVVRRARAPQGFVAAGFRGPARADRYGTFIPLEAVTTSSSPEQLQKRPDDHQRRTLKAFSALETIVECGALDSFVWGPTGSVGFELATARATVTETSDLDLLIRTPSPLSRKAARAMRDRLIVIEQLAGLRIDAQLETPAGGVALSEWAQDKPRVLARSAYGPCLITDPWASGSVPLQVQR